MPDFSSEALRKAVQDLPPEQGGIGVAVRNGEAGVQGAVAKSLGKGWSVSAVGSWFKETGYSAAAWLGWKGKP